jgi:6-aminohexanoate-oligomer exohydrolase
MAQVSTLNFVNPHLDSPGWTYVPVPAGDPDPLPPHPLPAAGEADLPLSLAEFHAETASTALLVLVGGVPVHEWYAPGVGPADLLLGASATKSLLAHLVGIAVRSGALGLDDLVAEHVPELSGGGYARVPVRALLSMTSGVDWVEDHRDPDGPATALIAAFGTGGSSRALLRRVGARAAPGTRFEYCTADSQVLDWVRERATGVRFPAACARLWAALGCAADAAIAVDGDGVALAGGGLAATVRDWARIGMLQVDGTVMDSTVGDGRGAAGERLLDSGWVDAASCPPLPFLAPGRLPAVQSRLVGFGYHWWPLDRIGARVSAEGSRGQFVWVDREHGVVVVKTSRWSHADPERDLWCRDLTYAGAAAIADAVIADTARDRRQP